MENKRRRRTTDHGSGGATGLDMLEISEQVLEPYDVYGDFDFTLMRSKQGKMTNFQYKAFSHQVRRHGIEHKQQLEGLRMEPVLTESQRKHKLIREVQGLDTKGSPEQGGSVHERLR